MLSSLFGVGNYTRNDSLQAKIKVELIKTDNSLFTLLDGTQFIELTDTDGQTGIKDELSKTDIPIGEYKGIKTTISVFKHKLMIGEGSESFYYTTNREINKGEQWLLSKNRGDYEYTTTNLLEPKIKEVTFLTPLVVTESEDSNLIWINEFDSMEHTFADGEDDSNISKIIWAGEKNVLRAFLPDIPKKKIDIRLVYIKNVGIGVDIYIANDINIFLNDTNQLIGSLISKLPDTPLAYRSENVVIGNHSDDVYTLRLQKKNDSDDGTIGDDYYDMNMTLTCSSNSLSNFTVTETENGTLLGNTHLETDGFSLFVGQVSCTDINL